MVGAVRSIECVCERREWKPFIVWSLLRSEFVSDSAGRPSVRWLAEAYIIMA